jgi:hypothetical protein
MNTKITMATLLFVLAVVSAASADNAMAPEYKACHAGNSAACTKWRVRACRDGNPAACDYDEAKKQSEPSTWCAQRYPDNAGQYRFCYNGSPDR